MKKLSLVSVVLLMMMGTAMCFAQESTDDTESFFNKQEEEMSKEPTIQDKKPETPQATNYKAKDISDLGKLAPFKDIAVIQKRFLPKTSRFELFGSLGMALNDEFFVDAALNLRLGYYFQERYGIELSGMAINSSTRKVTDSIFSRGVTTSSVVSPKSFYGIDFKWTPIYGKMAYDNKNITPFDMYFSAGVGSVTTNVGNSPALHLGTGQIFAMSKAFALRWDFSWNFYDATTSSGSGIYNNLFVLLGASWFFPEATYR